MTSDTTIQQLQVIHQELDRCRQCPNMVGPVVHGPPIAAEIMLIGQAPGPHEGSIGRPFAWTAGKTLFQWFGQSAGMSETELRETIYIAAVARCFPGKAASGGDRRPGPEEIAECSRFLKREVDVLQPKLIIPVGTLAIEQVLKTKTLLKDVIGRQYSISYFDVATDVIPLPHPSGLSSWHKIEPGRSLLKQALKLIADHPAMKK